MTAKTILVPVDGASNIKLETLDFETLATVNSASTESPGSENGGLKYNCTGKEFDWFDSIIQSLPEKDRAAAVVAPVARGASGGLVGADNSLMEVPDERLTLAYTQGYPEAVNDAFAKAGRIEGGFFSGDRFHPGFSRFADVVEAAGVRGAGAAAIVRQGGGLRPIRSAHGRTFHWRRLSRRHQVGRQRAQLLDVP